MVFSLYQKVGLVSFLSVGEASEMLVREEESLMLELTAMELTLSMLGY